MKKVTKINLFTSEKRFRKGFFDFCKQAKIEKKALRLRNAILHLTKNKAKFVHRNEELDIDDAYNFIRMRGIEARLPSLLAMYCDHRGIPYNDKINSHHTRSVCKITQMLMLWLADLPIPESIILTQYSYEANREYVLENISFPCVLKTYGSQGRNVWKINSRRELDQRLKLRRSDCKRMRKQGRIDNFLIQEYIKNDHDFRVSMFEGKVLGVIKRMSKDGFYNNWSRGADYEQSTISKEEEILSKRASEACQIDLSGVDFIRTDDGIVFLEVNKAPQLNVKYPAVVAEMIQKKYLK